MVLFNVIAFLVLKILLFQNVKDIISVPCKSLLLHFQKQLRDDTNMTLMKIVQFSRHPLPPLSIYVQTFSPPWPWTSNFTSFPPPHQMTTNQLKENIIQGWLLSAFGFSTNSLMLSGFSLTSFHLVEPPLLYLLLCGFILLCVQCNYSHFSTHFAINLGFFVQLENKLQNNSSTVNMNERNQNKSKTKTRHIQIDHTFYCSI